MPRLVRLIIVFALALGAFIGLVLWPGLGACSFVQSKKTNILLITIDTWRWDYLGVATGTEGLTPTLDALAQESMLFPDTRVVAPLTLVSHASILTGTTPLIHGVHDNSIFSLADDNITLSEVLKEHGYQTEAVTSAFVLNSRYGLSQGFDHYEEVYPGKDEESDQGGLAPMVPEINAQEATDKALRTLERLSDDGPWFLWVHYFDPHAAHKAPEPFASRFPKNPYAAEVAFVDSEIGRLLKSLKERKDWDRTILTVTSDHGEGRGEHFETTHAHFVYESTMRVASILRVPGVPGGQRFEERIRSIDFMPTFLDLAGVAVPERVQGQTLRPLWEGKPFAVEPAYGEAFSTYYEYGWSYLRSIVQDGWKYVMAPKPELYHLDEDPGEIRNLVESEPERAKAMLWTLRNYVDQSSAAAVEADAYEPSPEEQEILASLGYVGNSAQEHPGTNDEMMADLADPKDKIAVKIAVHKAWGESERGRNDAALEVFESVLEGDPQIRSIRRHAALLSREMGNWERSLYHLKKLAEYWPEEAWSYEYYKGRWYIKMDKTEKSVAHFKTAIALSRTEASNLKYRFERTTKELASALLELGRVDEARSALSGNLPLDRLGVFYRQLQDETRLFIDAGLKKEAIQRMLRIQEMFPDEPEVFLIQGNYYRDMGQIKPAIKSFEMALRLNPEYNDARNNLANLYGMSRDFKLANRYLDEILKTEPDNAKALSNKGLNYYHMDQKEEALKYFERAIAADSSIISARLNKVQIYMDRRDLARSVQICREIILIDPESPEAIAILDRFGPFVDKEQ